MFVCQLENGRHKEEDASHESGEGRGAFIVYILHIFHRPFHPDKFTGQMQSLLPM